MRGLSGKVVLVTGAGGGIGQGIVDRFVAEGAKVCAVDIDTDRLAPLAARHRADVRIVAADVARWQDNDAMVQACLESFGRLDVFIGNAGIFDHSARLDSLSGQQLQSAAAELLGVNLVGYLLGVRSSLEALRNSNGCVLLTGSFASTEPSGGGILYTTSKHAVVGAVRQLAYELAPRIRVNGVAPGVAPTTLKGIGALGQESMFAVFPGTESKLPLGRVPEAADFAGLYAFLASDDAAHITGSFFTADSGLAVRGIT